VIVSPGSGVFEVDKGLSSITYQRMLDNGIGSDMLSLGLPPLHIAPFFLYNVSKETVSSNVSFVLPSLTLMVSRMSMVRSILQGSIQTKNILRCHITCISRS
jgi:Vacuolar membrane-associated protein Iml1